MSGIRLAAPIALVLVLAPAQLDAHAVVFPQRTTPHTYEKFVLRVPNERDQPTVRVELAFPAAVNVVSFGDVAGWTLEITRDGSGRVARATWTGTLAAERFVEFPFVAVTPETEGRIVWPAVQVYEGGETVEWAGPEGSEAPASVTIVGADGSSTGPALWLAIGALILALVSLGVALRRGFQIGRPMGKAESGHVPTALQVRTGSRSRSSRSSGAVRIAIVPSDVRGHASRDRSQ